MFAGFTNADGDMIHDIPLENAEMDQRGQVRRRARENTLCFGDVLYAS
jgi:hypothetical protein